MDADKLRQDFFQEFSTDHFLIKPIQRRHAVSDVQRILDTFKVHTCLGKGQWRGLRAFIFSRLRTFHFVLFTSIHPSIEDDILYALDGCTTGELV